MELTINISDEQVKFLKQFAKNQHPGAKDNLATHKPLHLVQVRDDIITWDNGSANDGDIEYFEHDTQEYYTDEVELVETVLGRKNVDVKSFNELEYEELNGITIYTIEDYFKAYGLEVSLVTRIPQWRTVAYFFTLVEAKNYIEYQSHNLNQPRTYTVSMGYGNKGDYEPFFDLLMNIGQELNKNA